MSPKKDSAITGGWQAYAAAGVIFELFGLGFDLYDTAQNFAYGMSFGGWLVALVYAAAGLGMAFTMSALGWLRLPVLHPVTAAIAAMFSIFLVVTCVSAIDAHRARMGAQINRSANSKDELDTAIRNDNDARQTLKNAETAKQNADKTLAEKLDDPDEEIVDNLRNAILKQIDRLVDDAKARGIEADMPKPATTEAICLRLVKRCVPKLHELAALGPQLQAAKAKDEAKKAAQTAATELTEARKRADAAAEKLSALRSVKPDGGSSLTDAASIYGGDDATKAAREAAALNAKLFMVMTVSIAILGSFVGGWLLARSGEIRRQMQPKQPSPAKQAAKQASKQDRAAHADEPTNGQPEGAQTEPAQPKRDVGRKPRDPGIEQAELAATAQLIAQYGPQVEEKIVVAHLRNHYGTKRSTAQRRLAKALKAHEENAQSGLAQIHEPKVGSAHR